MKLEFSYFVRQHSALLNGLEGLKSLKPGPIGLKLGLTGLMLGRIGLKLSLTGLKLGLTGPNLSLIGLKLGLRSLERAQKH